MSSVTVTRTFLESDDVTPASGHVEFLLDRPLPTGAHTLAPTPIRATLNGAGAISVTLTSTTDSDTPGAMYSVTERFEGDPHAPHRYRIQVPPGGPYDLYDDLPHLTEPGVIYAQGERGEPGPPGVVGPDGNIQVVADYAALRGLTAGSYAHAQVKGSATALTGIAGVFAWDTDATDTDNGGTVIKPTGVSGGSPGRWKRLFDGPVYPEWFGALGNGTTNDYSAVLAAVNAAPNGHIHLTKRFNLGTQPVFDAPIRITGTTAAFISLGAADPDTAAKAGFVMAAGVSGPRFTVNAQFASMEHMEIESLSTVAGSDIGVTVEGRRFHASHCSVDNFGSHGWKVWGDVASGRNANVTMLEECRASGNRGDGFHSEGNDATMLTMLGCDAMLNAGHGYNIGSDHAFLLNCHANANTLDDILIAGQSCVVDAPYIEHGSAPAPNLVINDSNCVVRLTTYGRPSTITGNATGSASWFITENTLRSSQHTGTAYNGVWQKWSVFNPLGPDTGMQYDMEVGASGADQYSLRRRDTSTNPDTRQFIWRDRSDLARLTAEFYGDIAANTSNAQDIGRSGMYWRDVYMAGQMLLGAATRTISYGTGAPSASAATGSLYIQTDGVAGTTLWTKEPGAGATGWAAVGAGAALRTLNQYIFLVTGTISVATNVRKPGIRIAKATTLTDVALVADIAPAGAAILVDIILNGTTTVVTGASLPIATKKWNTSGYSVALAVNDVLTFNVTQVGSVTPGSDLAIQLIGS